jgi:hypothetical protein
MLQLDPVKPGVRLRIVGIERVHNGSIYVELLPVIGALEVVERLPDIQRVFQLILLPLPGKQE